MEQLLEHLDAVYRYALRLTGEAGRADDLTQETMLRGLKHAGRVRDRDAIRAWLLTITTNLHRDQCRRRAPSLLPVEEAETRASGDEEYTNREDVSRTLAALGELPERQRQAIHLVTVEGLSHAEAAEVMGVSVAAAKANLAAARKTLRRRLAEIDEQLRGRWAGTRRP